MASVAAATAPSRRRGPIKKEYQRFKWRGWGVSKLCLNCEKSFTPFLTSMLKSVGLSMFTGKYPHTLFCSEPCFNEHIKVAFAWYFCKPEEK